MEAGNDIGALVIPVGLAFEEAHRRHPALVLHKSDGTHPTLIGTYLAACTVYAAVYGRSTVGNPYTCEGAVPDATAKKLQQVAQDTVERFYRRQRAQPSTPRTPRPRPAAIADPALAAELEQDGGWHVEDGRRRPVRLPLQLVRNGSSLDRVE